MSTVKTTYQTYIDKIKNNNCPNIYITAINSEERSNLLTINELFKQINPPDLSIVICDQEIINIVKSECLLVKSKVFNIYCNDDSTIIAVELLKELKKMDYNQCNVTINSTSIKKETLLVILFALRNVLQISKIELIYITPKKYGDYIINGYNEPYCISFAHGLHQFGLPSLLLLLSGYERDGEFGLVRYFQPNLFLAGYAEPPSEADFKQRNIDNIKEVVKTFANDEGIKIDTFTFCGNDPEKCCNDIINYLKGNSYTPNKYNILIAPMNNKLTTIGAYLAYERLAEVIQLVDISGEFRELKSISVGKESVYITTLYKDDNKCELECLI